MIKHMLNNFFTYLDTCSKDQTMIVLAFIILFCIGKLILDVINGDKQ